jgi:polynucleotide 5'-kinase involved in rRNA processing
VFGAELPPECPVYFPKGSKFSIFTWHKATVLITGNVDGKYTSDDTRMPQYLEIHGNIQEDRENAMLRRQAGPNIVVCGSSNSGKSTV